MKVFIYMLLVLIIMMACAEKNDYKQIQEVRRLEFQRSAEVGIFDKLITSDNTDLRILVADAIAKIGDPIHQSALMKMLPDKNPALINKVIFALGQIGDQDSLLFSLIDRPIYQPYSNAIIAALGRSKNKSSILALLARLPGLHDSSKVIALQSISFIAPNNYENREVIKKLSVYLQSEEVTIRAAAVYFFSRHPHASALPSLIRMSLKSGSIEDKYRLKAISGALRNYYIQSADTALFDSLKQRIISDLNETTLNWRHKLYELAILRSFENEAAYRPAIPYLKDDNPHLRRTAIETLSASDSLEAKQALIKIYPEASWADKGHIILALSKKYPEMTYPLIQQNLDKSNIYFKQLLLRSLAVIKSRMSVNQLKQFLQVPNTRLKYTAFDELWKLRLIGYEHARGLLLSGDLALSTLAANWITEHPEWASFDDLSTAYHQYTEPTGVESMVEILKTLALVRGDKTDIFMIDTYQKTHSFTIASQIEKILPGRNLSINKRTDLKPLLFVPDTINFEQESINVQIITEKGDLLLKLYPDVAPATVANFIDLINKGFYTNLPFHRVVSDFVIQGGDPRGDGWGGPGYSIPCEYNERSFKRGTLGLATAGKDTGGCQFFICHSEQPHLNRRYTVFGEVVSGIEIVDIIEIDDTIKQIIILK